MSHTPLQVCGKGSKFRHAHHYLVIGHTPTLFQSGAMGAGNAGFVVSQKKYDVLFDTGSNAISLPADIYDRVQDRNYNKGVMALTFDTLNGDDSMTLRVDYDRRDRFNAQVLRSHGELLIIGITFIAGHTLGFEDDGTRRIMTMDLCRCIYFFCHDKNKALCRNPLIRTNVECGTETSLGTVKTFQACEAACKRHVLYVFHVQRFKQSVPQILDDNRGVRRGLDGGKRI